MLFKAKSLFLLLFFLLCNSVIGQDLNNLQNTDLSSVNVDALTDAQIQKFLERAQESGLTMDQMELIAIQRGMSSSQVSKLRTRIRQLQSGIGGKKENELITSPDRLREQNTEEDSRLSFFEELISLDSIKRVEALKIFGLDIFRQNNLTFEPSLNAPTPDNYVLGAGDEVIIDVYGASEITYQEVISPDGKIIISGIGPISLAGISVKEARNRLFNRLSSIYSGLKGSRPNTFFQFSIGQVKTIKVNVVGHVVQPGTYSLSSFSSAFNALYFAGGPTEIGSMREIEVNRNGKKVASLDVYAYLFGGDDSQNPLLQDQDIIVVKPYVTHVKLVGNTKNRAIYEMKESETIESLLRISGGFNELAYKKSITINRYGESQRSIKTVKSDFFSQELLQDGDSIYINKILDRYSNRVKIEGAVKHPGYYELQDQMTLSSLIILSDGVLEDAYLKRGNIIRLQGDLSLTNLTFETVQVLNGSQDVLLSPNDIIRIPSIFDLEEEKKITLVGEVKRPGDYPFIDNMTVEDLINISGGLLKTSSKSKVEVARRVENSNDGKLAEIHEFTIDEDYPIGDTTSSFGLMPFDLVTIKINNDFQPPKVVKIEGEVEYPGFYVLENSEDKILNLLKRAGGLTDYAYTDGGTLIRRTEYFRTEYEKEELESLIQAKRNELEQRYKQLNVGSSNGESSLDLIERELKEYENEITETIKLSNSSQLEARIFRAQQLRKLAVRDSLSGAEDLIEQQNIGVNLSKIFNDENSDDNLILQDGDIISIPRKLQTVNTRGEVLYPTSVKYQGTMSLKKYVSLSGGFTDKAKPSKAYIVYANGNAQRTRNFLWFKIYPKVEPGSDILIPKKTPKRKLSAQEILGISSSLATMALIIDRLTN